MSDETEIEWHRELIERTACCSGNWKLETRPAAMCFP